MEEYLEFEDIHPNGSPLERILDKSNFRKEYRIPRDDDLKIFIGEKLYKVSNLSSHGFQMMAEDIENMTPGTKVDFKLFFDNHEINGVGIIQYIEKIDLDLYVIGIKIEMFLEKSQEEEYEKYVERLRNKVLNSNVDDKLA
ncbi:hypothetical protein JCM12298_11960 [Desulfothermus naphthae]